MTQHKSNTIPRRSPRIQGSQIQKDFNKLLEEPLIISTREEQAKISVSSFPTPIFTDTPLFLDTRYIRAEHSYLKSFLGGVFEDVSPTLQDNEKHPSNMWKILHFACMNKELQPGNLDHTYQSTYLYFVTYSIDDPYTFEYSPVEAFNPFKEGGFARMLFDSSGRIWPKEPKQYIYRIAENANQVNQRIGVTQHSLLTSLSPQQVGVLLGSVPMVEKVPAWSIMIIRQIMRKVYTMLTKEDMEEGMKNKWANIKFFIPLLCAQAGPKVSKDLYMNKLKDILSRVQQEHIDSFTISELRIRSNHRRIGKSTASNFYDRVNKKVEDLCLSQAYKILNGNDMTPNPALIHQELGNHLFKHIPIHKEEEILQPIVGGEHFKATVQMVKQAILLSKPKKSPGLDGVTSDFFKVLINGGKGDISNKHDILKLLTIYFNNVLNGKMSQHEAHILYSQKLIGIPKDETKTRAIMMANTEAKIIWAVFHYFSDL